MIDNGKDIEECRWEFSRSAPLLDSSSILGHEQGRLVTSEQRPYSSTDHIRRAAGGWHQGC